MNPTNTYKHIFLVLISIISILLSCETTQNDNIVPGDALLNLSIEGLDFETKDQIIASNQSVNNELKPETHIQYVDEDLHIESQLLTIQESPSKNIKSNLKQTLSANSELQSNIKYKLLVYNNGNKNLVKEKDFTYKTENLAAAIPLDTYTEYIFVVVSSGSRFSLPTINNVNNLNTATIESGSANILHWVSPVMKLNSGQNFLAAKLNPKYSEITVTLQMDQAMTGSITTMSKPVIKPIAETISISLATGEATEVTGKSTGEQISIPTLGSGRRSVTSSKTTIVHNNTNAGTLTFPLLTVDGETKSNITVRGLNLKPGRKYNLILTLKSCTEAINGGKMEWNYKQVSKDGETGINFINSNNQEVFKKNTEVISFTFTESGTDDGFIYDIELLDNAFNLKVNETLIFGNNNQTSEIQFQNGIEGYPQNIEFEDGSQYQGPLYKNNIHDGSVPAIWSIKGTTVNPVVRVIIGKYGDVIMLGSKESGGPLFPLRLKNGNNFNKVTWKGGGQTNNVIATTRVEGETVMKSTGSGRKKIQCSK